jgi:hypothetical protein
MSATLQPFCGPCQSLTKKNVQCKNLGRISYYSIATKSYVTLCYKHKQSTNLVPKRSSAAPTAISPMKECCICMTDVDSKKCMALVSKNISITGDSSVQKVHEYVCRDCLFQHISICISEAKIPIPHYRPDMNLYLKDKVVESILLEKKPSLLNTYRTTLIRKTLQKIRAKNASFHICPSCGLYGTYQQTKFLTCDLLSCGKTWCRECDQIGDHGRKPCMWISPTMKDMKDKVRILIERIIDLETTFRCPRCKIPIEKTTGCNHITCTNCKTHSCYICREKTPAVVVDGVIRHYHHWNRNGATCPLYGDRKTTLKEDSIILMMKVNKHSYKVRKEIREQAKKYGIKIGLFKTIFT